MKKKNSSIQLRNLLLCGLLVVASFGCGEYKPSNSAQAAFKVFPGIQACNYPTNSSVEKYRDLGGGYWRYAHFEGGEYDYDCGKAEKRFQWPMLDGSRQIGRIAIEYGVTGNEEGALSLGYDYDVEASGLLPEEAEFRREFVTLIEETVRQAFNAPLPQEMKAGMLDLNSFKPSGVKNRDTAEFGDGKLWISRNRSTDGSYWLIKVQLCADKRFSDCSTS